MNTLYCHSAAIYSHIAAVLQMTNLHCHNAAKGYNFTEPLRKNVFAVNIV